MRGSLTRHAAPGNFIADLRVFDDLVEAVFADLYVFASTTQGLAALIADLKSSKGKYHQSVQKTFNDLRYGGEGKMSTMT